ncbi:MAG: hypothetical protein VCF08_02515 [Alphaproteobacteria bacterium]
MLIRAKDLTTLLPAAFAAMGFAAAPLPALAAPQMMALVASNAAVPMQCKQGH